MSWIQCSAMGPNCHKWEPHSKWGQFLGNSLIHASTIGLILNLQTGNITSQYILLTMTLWNCSFEWTWTSSRVEWIVYAQLVQCRTQGQGIHTWTCWWMEISRRISCLMTGWSSPKTTVPRPSTQNKCRNRGSKKCNDSVLQKINHHWQQSIQLDQFQSHHHHKQCTNNNSHKSSQHRWNLDQVKPKKSNECPIAMLTHSLVQPLCICLKGRSNVVQMNAQSRLNMNMQLHFLCKSNMESLMDCHQTLVNVVRQWRQLRNMMKTNTPKHGHKCCGVRFQREWPPTFDMGLSSWNAILMECCAN